MVRRIHSHWPAAAMPQGYSLVPLPYSGSCGRHYPISGRTQLFTWSECAGVCGGLQQEVLRGVPAVSLRSAGSFMKSPQRHCYDDDEYLRSFR
jgi:hypothetical protein